MGSQPRGTEDIGADLWCVIGCQRSKEAS